MADQPDTHAPHVLRRIDETLDRVIGDIYGPTRRMTRVGEGLAGVNRRLDRLDVRADRIEPRLELSDKPV